jgi:hypothetical protein
MQDRKRGRQEDVRNCRGLNKIENHGRNEKRFKAGTGTKEHHFYGKFLAFALSTF